MIFPIEDCDALLLWYMPLRCGIELCKTRCSATGSRKKTIQYPGKWPKYEWKA
jgi:hypothetical protein